MRVADNAQPTITERLDSCIERILTAGETPRAIFLTERDRARLDGFVERLHRESTGSTAFVFPTSYADVPIISEHLIAQVEIPVRQSHPEPRRSTIYSDTGRGFPVDLA